MMGFNSRFATKPAVANSGLITPPETKLFVKSVDEYEVEEQTPLRSSDRSQQSEAPSADDSRSSSPKIPRL